MLNHRPLNSTAKKVFNECKHNLYINTPELKKSGEVRCESTLDNINSFVLAGGYVRDHLLNTYQQDLDMYIDITSLPSCYEGMTYEKIADHMISTFKKQSKTNLTFDEAWKTVHSILTGGTGNYTISNTGGVTISPTSNLLTTAKYISQKVTTHSSKQDVQFKKPTSLLNVVKRKVYLNVEHQSNEDEGDCDHYPDTAVFNVDFMFVAKNAVSYINEEFCVNISKVYYDGNKIHMPTSFISSMMNKHLVFEFNHELTKQEQLYVDKIKAKFSDYSSELLIKAPKSC